MLIDFADVVFLREGIGNALLQLALVGLIIEQYGIGLGTVASGTASFLEVGFDAVGTVDMHYQSYIGLVDTHTEGIGGYHHAHLVGLPCLLPLVFHSRVKAGMIECGCDAFFVQQI